MDAQLARLESDVEHIKVDVQDIKADIRRLDQKIDEKIDGVNERIDSVNGRIDGVNGKIDGVKDSLTTFAIATERSFTNVEKSIASAKLWAMGLYIALAAGLLCVLARGFKWI